MYVYKTDIAVLSEIHRTKFEVFPGSALEEIRAATYGVVCQDGQLLSGVLPVLVCTYIPCGV